MTVLHSGTSRKYSQNWAKAFGAPKAKASADKGGKTVAPSKTGSGKKTAGAKKSGKR